MSRDDYKNIKVLCVGESGVGKTSIAERYVTGKFSQTQKPTMGTHIQTKKINEIETNFFIWDVSGLTLAPNDINVKTRGTHILLFVVSYEKNLDDQLQYFQNWLDTIESTCLDNLTHHIVVINKSDLPHQWELDQKTKSILNSVLLKKNMTEENTFISISAKNNIGFDLLDNSLKNAANTVEKSFLDQPPRTNNSTIDTNINDTLEEEGSNNSYALEPIRQRNAHKPYCEKNQTTFFNKRTPLIERDSQSCWKECIIF